MLALAGGGPWKPRGDLAALRAAVPEASDYTVAAVTVWLARKLPTTFAPGIADQIIDTACANNHNHR